MNSCETTEMTVNDPNSLSPDQVNADYFKFNSSDFVYFVHYMGLTAGELQELINYQVELILSLIHLRHLIMNILWHIKELVKTLDL